MTQAPYGMVHLAQPCTATCPQVSLKECPHAMCFRGRHEAVGIQEQGCSLPPGLGKHVTWERVCALWEKCCLSKPLSLATSCLCAELAPFFPPDPRC